MYNEKIQTGDIMQYQLLTTENYTEEELKEFYFSVYPGGSGPLNLMKLCTHLIENIARIQGYDINKWVEEKNHVS